MRLENLNVSVETNTIQPALRVVANFVFAKDVEVLLSVSGKLSVGGKSLVNFIETPTTNREPQELKLLSKNDLEVFLKLYPAPEAEYTAIFQVPLCEKDLAFIEKTRESRGDKSANFYFEFFAKKCSYQLITNGATEQKLKTQNEHLYQYFEIKQSDWINHYISQLGIGKFMLLEFQLPDSPEIPEFWELLYNQLTQNLKDMEDAMNVGDWTKTMFLSRRFFENIKIGDATQRTPDRLRFKEEFDILMRADQHDQEGINDFYDGLWKFFNFTSKYVHEQDRTGRIRPIINCKKEDAYFVYALAIGLLNFLGSKIATNY